MSADEIAKLKEDTNQAPFESVLKRAMWSEWLLRVQSRTQCVLHSNLPAKGALPQVSAARAVHVSTKRRHNLALPFRDWAL